MHSYSEGLREDMQFDDTWECFLFTRDTSWQMGSSEYYIVKYYDGCKIFDVKSKRLPQRYLGAERIWNEMLSETAGYW